MLCRVIERARRWKIALDESGQSTAEYALVILGAVAVATMLIQWATGSHAITKLFDSVVNKVLPS